MINNLLNIFMEAQSGDHLVGINCHFNMYLEGGDTMKVSWASIVERTINHTRYTVPQHFQDTAEYKNLAKEEYKNKIPYKICFIDN